MLLSFVGCHIEFNRAIFRVESDNDLNRTMLEFKRHGEDTWNTCFEYPRSLDYTVHTYFSAGGRKTERRGVFINSIKFYDNERVIEGEQELLDAKSYRDYSGTAKDLLHEGNLDGVLLKDEQKGKDAYNDKILKYNSKYA